MPASRTSLQKSRKLHRTTNRLGMNVYAFHLKPRLQPSDEALLIIHSIIRSF